MFDGEHNSLALTGGSFAFHSAVPPARKKRAKNQRRFSEAQIKSLESIFRTETKLEPRKKLQVAAELGLQPRQVGIWFQNKRARWKSKQLERDHSILRSKYNAMASQVELLRQEKQSLMTQLQSLSSLIQGRTDKGQCCGVDGDSGNPGSGVAVPSDEDSSIKAEYLGMGEEAAFMGMVEPAENSLTSAENWEDPLDECCSDYEWWDFWS